MATETITGCVDFSTGEIIFSQGNCQYHGGCMIWSGIHAGQVSVTIDNMYCQDTYYGCVDLVTGKFEVVVPDDCCDMGCDCTYCWEENTPAILTIKWGITNTGVYPLYPGSHCHLHYMAKAIQWSVSCCIYRNTGQSPSPHYEASELWHMFDCEGNPYSEGWTEHPTPFMEIVVGGETHHHIEIDSSGQNIGVHLDIEPCEISGTRDDFIGGGDCEVNLCYVEWYPGWEGPL